MRGSRTRSGIVLALAVLALLAVGVAITERRPLRAAEAAYLDGRNITACATRALRPFAESGRDMDDLPEALEELVVEAHAEAQEVQRRGRELSGGLLPSTRAAVRAVQDALDAQVALYQVMVSDPQASEDELTSLGRANGTAERRLRAGRSWIAAGEPRDWPARYTCRAAPSEGQASSVSSSSK